MSTTGRSRFPGFGFFIAFEGGDGAGKSTQVALLSETIRSAGWAVRTTHEPGATPLGAQLRRLLLDSAEPIEPREEALLFAADRAHHVASVIRPALVNDEVVITDRFVDSSLAYQGAGRTLPVDELRKLSEWATGGLVPALTVLLDIAPEAGLSRLHTRSGGHLPDRLERQTIDFHTRVRAGFLDMAAADPGRYLVLDARRGPDDLAAQIATAVLSRLSALGSEAVVAPEAGPEHTAAASPPVAVLAATVPGGVQSSQDSGRNTHETSERKVAP